MDDLEDQVMEEDISIEQIVLLFKQYFPRIQSADFSRRKDNKYAQDAMYEGIARGDIEPFLEKNSDGNVLLDIKGMVLTEGGAIKNLWTNIFPSRKKADLWQALDKKLDEKEVFDVVEFFITEEDKKFEEGFNKTVKKEFHIASRKEPVHKIFFDEIEAKKIYAYPKYSKTTRVDRNGRERIESQRILEWDFSRIVSHKGNSVYRAYESFAHKNYTLLRYGRELDFYFKHPEKLPSIDAIGKVLTPKLKKEMNAGDFIYPRLGKTKVETTTRVNESPEPDKQKKIEERKKERKEHFLSKIGLDTKDKSTLSELYYGFFIALMNSENKHGNNNPEEDESSEKKQIALAKKFLTGDEGILTFNIEDFLKTTRYNYDFLEIDNAFESIPKKSSMYIPASLEELLRQIASKLCSPKKDDFIDVPVRGGNLIKIIDQPFEKKQREQIKDCYEKILGLLPTRSQQRFEFIDGAFDFLQKDKLIQYFEKSSNLNDKIKMLNKIIDSNQDINGTLGKTIVSNMKRLSLRIPGGNLEDPIGDKDDAKNSTKKDLVKETKYHDPETSALLSSLVERFKRKFNGEDEKPFLDWLNKYIEDHMPADWLQKETFIITYYDRKELFNKYCELCDMDPRDRVMKRQFFSKLKNTALFVLERAGENEH
jgi:hypothetical protein